VKEITKEMEKKKGRGENTYIIGEREETNMIVRHM
jgi:hypothetical protein